MLEFFENLNFADVVILTKHMMSLFSNLLSDSKSIGCLLIDLILSSIITNELPFITSTLGGKNMHSK